MNKMILSVALLSLVFLCNNGQAQNMELVISHVLFRHGDRTPVSTFPTDPIQQKDWPNGFGQLTQAGIEQHHRLGSFLRSRYNTFLNATYVTSEVSVRSTDFDRTLMSGQSNLAGLYPALNVGDNLIPVQPIPIHTVPIKEDFLLGQNDCPRYDQLEIEIDQSDEMKDLNKKYASFFQQLEQWTGFNNITVYTAWDVADTILVEHIYNRTPVWATDDVRQTLSDINDLGFHFLFKNNDTQRIRGGPLVQDVWMSMNRTAHGESSQKLRIYSAHDTTLGAVLSFLGINYPHQPQYASALFIDLYKQGTNYFVKVEYLNVTDSNKTFSYVLPGCTVDPCPWDAFTKTYQSRFPSTPDKECAKSMPPMPPSNGNGSALIAVLVVIILVLITGIGAAFWCLRLRRAARDPPLLSANRNSEFA